MHPAPTGPTSIHGFSSRLTLPTLTAIAIRNLARHRRRSAVNVLGIAVTVAALLFFQAFYRGSYEEFMFGAIIDHQCAHLQLQARGFVEEDPDTYTSARCMIDGWPELRSRLRALPDVQGVSARLLVPGFVGNGMRKRAVLLTGVEEAADRAVLRTLDRLHSGTRLTGPGQILIGASLAARFGLGPGDELRVQVRTVDDVPNVQAFTIAGLFATGYPQIDRGTAFVGLADLQELASAGDRVNRFYIRVASMDRVDRVHAAIVRVLAEARGAQGTASLVSTTWADFAAGILRHSRTDRLFMVVFLSILLAMAISTVAGTMFMAVFERTREIGTLRASGWDRREVFRLFAIEAALIGTGGAALGALLGGGACAWLAWFPLDLGGAVSALDVPFLRVTCRLTGLDVAISLGAGIASAAVAGIAPARRAAHIVIARALEGGHR